MTRIRSWMIFVLALSACISGAQSWIGEYDKGLDAAKKGDWSAARAAFQQAVAFRPEDTDKPTRLPGPVTEQRLWRDGVPYSPNFLAAYASYRTGVAAKDQDRSTAFQQASTEFEMLIQKGQGSREAFYFLNLIYTNLGDTAKRQALEAKFAGMGAKSFWKVDTSIVTPEERAAIESVGGTKTGDPTVTKIPNSTGVSQPTAKANSGTGLNPLVGPVSPVANKYALIIGNGDSKIQDMAIPFAADDAQRMREALIVNAGYPEANVDLVLNATGDQIMKSAAALAERIGDDSTVFIYFGGAGVNVNGKDLLAGIDTESAMDSGTMVSKSDLFKLFLNKGARVFSFFQTNRPITNGRYFGSEIPMVGQLAQVQATMPGEKAQGYVQNGKLTGLFTNAMIRVMAEQRSNQLPILEFGWQIFYKMRRGDTGSTGGSSRQTCTLPVLTNLASDARF